jgi:hypothetical protein
LASGSPAPIERRVFEAIVSQAANALETASRSKRMLVIRLNLFRSAQLGRAADQPATIPVAMRSPLGSWASVEIPMPVGPRASWSLLQMPSWIPIWKAEYDVILIDLGPVNLVPSRVLGRFCKSNFMVIGPARCASAEWIQMHVDWHAQAGSTIQGSLLITHEQTASAA